MSSKLPRELDALTAKRRAFCLAYVGEAHGNAMEAARIAGYATPDPEGARLLGNDRVRAAIEALRAPIESAQIASREERQKILTRYARAELEAADRDRLKAIELLGKMDGDYTEKREVHHTGATGPNIQIVMTREQRRAGATEKGEGE